MARLSDAFAKSPHVQLNVGFAQLASTLAKSYQPQPSAGFAALASTLVKSYQPQQTLAPLSALASSVGFAWQAQHIPAPSSGSDAAKETMTSDSSWLCQHGTTPQLLLSPSRCISLLRSPSAFPIS
jgi:hypothetical protein